MEGVQLAASTVKALAFENFNTIFLGGAYKNEVLAKPFYTQLPYMLGEHHAMKLSLVPRQFTCQDGQPQHCCLPEGQPFSTDFASRSARITAEFLEACETGASFELHVQVKEFADDEETIMRGAAQRWYEPSVHVATLWIPQQVCDKDLAVNQKLKARLSNKLNIDPNVVDKAFAFHPINTHEANRPVGDVQTFRGGFYSQHMKMRLATMHGGVFTEAGNASLFHMPATMAWDVIY